MDKSRTLEIIKSLAEGIDPTSGEVFSLDSPYQNVEIVRALFHASKIIEGVKVKVLPENAGSPWTDEEHQKVVEDYFNEIPISKIAKEHQRTPGAIRSRLKKAGVIDS